MAEVRVVKLINGSEVIGRYEDTPSGVVMQQVLTIVLIPQENGVALALHPFSFAASMDQKVALDRAHILAVLSPAPDFEKQYLAQTSGLVLPDATPQSPRLHLVD